MQRSVTQFNVLFTLFTHFGILDGWIVLIRSGRYLNAKLIAWTA